jgi:hypothetical protein
VAQGPQATTFAGGTKRPELSCDRQGAERIDVGSWRGSGRPDVARVYKRSAEAGGPAVLSCREVDLDGDGRKDVVVYYEPDGRKLREEFDQDYDGIADVKSFYAQGQLVRQELDTNHDGKADVVQYIESGKIIRVERVTPGAEPEKPAATDANVNRDKAAAATTSSEPAVAAPVAPASAAPASPKTGG